jgi:TFIIF-interacting CTD phosphatase-like protein
MNIVLDIDETLIHAVSRKHKDAAFSIKFNTGGNIEQYYILQRPGLKAFLKFVFNNFATINVWTAATKDYAIAIMSKILTRKQISSLRFFNTRKQCSVDGSKPLNDIFNTKEAKGLNIMRHNTLMIDDKVEVVKHNKGNGIIVPAWNGNKKDNALHRLTILLDTILKSKLLPVGDKIFKLNTLIK